MTHQLQTRWLGLSLLAACAGGETKATSTASLISGDSIRARTAILGSDSFQGRAPGTHGDTLATAYITAAFQRLGLAGGMPDGSFRQTAPFWAGAAKWSIALSKGGKTVDLDDSTTSIVWESAPTPEVAIDDAAPIYVGFGIDAPEVGWKDYKVPTEGRIAIALYGEPSRPDPTSSAKADTTFFLGDELGWYGWISHKTEAAGANGVAALILVVDEKTSGVPWSALQSYARERSHLKPDPKYPKQTPNVFFVNRAAAERMFGLVGRRYDDMVRAANDSGFKPVVLPAKTSVRIHQRIREYGSDNVIGRIPGSDLRGEAVIFSAHWDHMGIDTTKAGDQIYNGALDNAVGVAALLELARAFKNAPKPPRRTLLFIATTAEEQLLLGAQYYAYHPVVSLDSTVADLDIDGVNVLGAAHAVSTMGLEESTLGEQLADVAKAQSRTVIPNPMLVAGGRYRTDRFAFARLGVPGIIIEGAQLVGKTREQEEQLSLDYLIHRYHQVTDSVRSDWDFTGAADDLRLFYELGSALAQGGARPTWKTGRRHTLMFGPALSSR
jgi:hypothetical protein